MRIPTRWISGIVVVFLAGLFSTAVGLRVVRGSAQDVRWDIVSIATGSPLPGGKAFASAQDGSHLKLTGSGTFVAPAGGDGTSSATTGGGTWQTFSPSNVSTGSGTYEVTGLVRWEEKGTFPALPDNAVGGLAILRVEFSDGSDGVLTVSCHAASGSNPAIFEGIRVSKSFVDYWNGVPPFDDANRTLFHNE